MTHNDYLEIEANMLAWNGKHWLDAERRVRLMEYRGFRFKWNPDAEIWQYDEEDA